MPISPPSLQVNPDGTPTFDPKSRGVVTTYDRVDAHTSNPTRAQVRDEVTARVRMLAEGQPSPADERLPDMIGSAVAEPRLPRIGMATLLFQFAEAATSKFERFRPDQWNLEDSVIAEDFVAVQGAIQARGMENEVSLRIRPGHLKPISVVVGGELAYRSAIETLENRGVNLDLVSVRSVEITRALICEQLTSNFHAQLGAQAWTLPSWMSDPFTDPLKANAQLGITVEDELKPVSVQPAMRTQFERFDIVVRESFPNKEKLLHGFFQGIPGEAFQVLVGDYIDCIILSDQIYIENEEKLQKLLLQDRLDELVRCFRGEKPPAVEDIREFAVEHAEPFNQNAFETLLLNLVLAQWGTPYDVDHHNALLTATAAERCEESLNAAGVPKKLERLSALQADLDANLLRPVVHFDLKTFTIKVVLERVENPYDMLPFLPPKPEETLILDPHAPHARLTRLRSEQPMLTDTLLTRALEVVEEARGRLGQIRQSIATTESPATGKAASLTVVVDTADAAHRLRLMLFFSDINPALVHIRSLSNLSKAERDTLVVQMIERLQLRENLVEVRGAEVIMNHWRAASMVQRMLIDSGLRSYLVCLSHAHSGPDPLEPQSGARRPTGEPDEDFPSSPRA